MANNPNGNVTPMPTITNTTPAPKPPAYDPTDNLTGANRDAAKALVDLFTQYGLGSLAARIVGFIQAGYSSDTITLELQKTPEYKTRFAANEARVKKGLPALSPAEYVATERSYRDLMASAGLPLGFYDSKTDFQKFLENDISPTELKGRIDVANDAVRRAPKQTLDYFKQWYSDGDLVAYALDANVAAPLIEQRIKAAEAAGLAKNFGTSISKTSAEVIGGTGQNFDQIQQGLSFVAQEAQTTDKLSQIYNGPDVTADDLVKEVFQNDATAAGNRKKLASQERAAFSKSGGLTAASFGKDAGTI